MLPNAKKTAHSFADPRGLSVLRRIESVFKSQKTDNDQHRNVAFWAPTRPCMRTKRAFLDVVINCRWENSSTSGPLSMKGEISKHVTDEIIEWKTF